MNKLQKIVLSAMFMATVSHSLVLVAKKPKRLSRKTEKRILKRVFEHFEREKTKSWIKAALWFAVPIVAQITLQEILVDAFARRPTQQERDLKEIRTLTAIHNQLGKQLFEIKKGSSDVAEIKKMEERHEEACKKIIALEKRYLEVYARPKE